MNSINVFFSNKTFRLILVLSIAVCSYRFECNNSGHGNPYQLISPLYAHPYVGTIDPGDSIAISHILNLNSIDLILLRRIIHVENERVTSLFLTSKNNNLTYLDTYDKIDTLPIDICYLSALCSLYVNGNSIQSLPLDIQRLSNLQFINLNDNQINRIPNEICLLKRLKTLLIRDNLLTMLPDSITKLDSLSTLDVFNNHIQHLPDSIHQMLSMSYLEIGKNNLSVIPANLGNLPSLVYLYASRNQLQSLPISISKLRSLTSLDVSENQLTELPDSIVNIGTNFNFISFSKNKLCSLQSDVVVWLNKVDSDWFLDQDCNH